MVQDTRKVVVVADDDPLACQAARILADKGGEGVNILTVGQLPEHPDDDHVMFTSRERPFIRFPGAHVTYDGDGTVFVRKNPTKDRRNPEGFTTAVLDMGRRLGILSPLPPKARRSRPRVLRRAHPPW